MQKFVTYAIGSALAISAVLAHADAKPMAAEGISSSPSTKMPPQAEGAEPMWSMVRTATALSAGVQSRTSPSASSDDTNTTGMLVGALAIMAVVARRRWHNRS